MYDVYLTYRSVTRCQVAKTRLDRAGILTDLRRSPRQLSPAGCGYALLLRRRQLPEALRVLEQTQTLPRGVFVRSPEGGFTEVSP